MSPNGAQVTRAYRRPNAVGHAASLCVASRLGVSAASAKTATLRQLAASSSLPNLVALVTGRLADLRQLGIVPELTGSLATPLLAASQSREMPLPRHDQLLPD